MSVRLPEHSHCANCGDPTPYGTFFCNDACRAQHKAKIRKENLRDLAFYATVGVALCLLAYRFVF